MQSETRVTTREYIKSVRDAIHGPRFEGFPIYGKVNTDDRSNASEKGMLSNERWVAYTQVNNTSPSNVRAVFIAPTQVVVIHYNSISKKTASVVRSEKLVPPKSLLNMQDLYTMLGALSNPWVCSNIEEIFINSALFMPPVQQGKYVLKGNEGNLCAELFIKANITKSAKVKVSDILNRFPRLRAISCITPNISVQNIINGKKVAISSSNEGTEKYRDAKIGLYSQLENSQSANTFIFQSAPSNAYTLRKGDYLYDSKLTAVEELAEAVKKHNLDIRTKEVQEKYSTADKGTANEKPEIEKYLDAIEKKEHGMAVLAFKNLDRESMLDVLKEFSNKGQEYYGKLLNIGGDK